MLEVKDDAFFLSQVANASFLVITPRQNGF
jgi:hypothetical protein